MSAVLIKILNLRLWLRRTLAVIFTLAIHGVLVIALWLPYSLINNLEAENQERQRQLGRLHAVIDVPISNEPAEKEKLAPALFLEGNNEGLLQASLQSRVSGLANNHSVALNSVGPVNSFESDGIQYVGINTNLSGTVSNLHKLLLAIENGSPALLVKSVKFNSQRLRSDFSPELEPQITTQMSIFGAIDPINRDKS